VRFDALQEAVMGLVASRVIRGVVAGIVVAGIGLGPGAGASAAVKAHKFHPPRVQKVRVLPREYGKTPAAGTTARDRVTAATRAELRTGRGARPDSRWPGAASGAAELPKLATATGTKGSAAVPAAAVRADDAPVTVRAGNLRLQLSRTGAVEAGPAGAAGSGPVSQVGVQVLDHAAAAAAGVDGVLFTVSSPGQVAGRLKVDLGYSPFAAAEGADFGQRLHLAELPACALTTPRVRACQVQTALPSSNNARSGQVSAAVQLAAAQPAADLFPAVRPQVTPARTGAALVMAAVAGGSGPSGDFTATTLKPAGTWSAGGSSGAFTWSYPITAPPPAAGSAPSLALSYNSALVDGETAQTNNQDSEVGQGFELSDNYIARSYVDCADDPEGKIANDYDNCWAGNVVTMSLNGQSTPLILDASSGTWHEQSDSGDEVQYETGTSANTGNGTYDNDYWVVTTPDGTQYYFGKNKGPGWASGDPVTNSAWTEPVYGAHSGDPCYNSTFSQASCSQAWRWNLDFVIDPEGNATAYYYDAETNYYGADNQTTGVVYDRAGYLTQVDYGLRDENGSIYAGSTDSNPPDEVVFTAAQRCIPVSGFACTAAEFTAANASYWPDTPQSEVCASGASCSNHSPSFWSQMRIDAITTQYYNGSKYVEVDNYALGQDFPVGGDSALQLATITRTGYSSSGSSLALPPVDLSYQLLDNRVPGYNSEPSMAMWRLTGIEAETGEVIEVQYTTNCTSSVIPSSPSANTTQCYPIYWTPLGDSSPILDYFDKYVTSTVTVQDGSAGDPAQLTTYDYLGNPAWHYDDNQLVKAADRTYGQWRGYENVETLTGNPQNITNGSADVQTMTKTTYYQGMYGDTLPGGGTSTTQVSDSLNEKYNDYEALAGMPLETQTFNGVTGAQLTDKITQSAVTAVTATSAPVTGLPAPQASMTGVTTERDFTDLAGGGQNVLTTVSTYDGFGRVVLQQKSGTAIAETCTQTTYDDNTSASVWIRDAVSESIVATQACPAAVNELTAADITSDTRTFYDGATSLTTPPARGLATQVNHAVTNTGGSLTWQTEQITGYDSSGRVTSSQDGLGNTTATAYTPADGGPLTTITTTNALNQVTTKTVDPGRGSTLSTTDTSGYLTSYAYDPLGRVTGAWKPGRSQSGGASANYTYSYQVSQTAPLAVTTNTLIDYGSGTSYVTSISIYDSLGQLRQTQTAAEGGNTAVSDTFYDSHGWVWETNNKYVVAGSPSASVVDVAESAVNDRSINTYNGAGQVTDQQDYNGNTLTDSTQTVQGGAQVTTIGYSAAGSQIGTPSATVTNVLGQTTQTIQYAGTPTVSSAGVVSGGSPQVTTTTYDSMGDQAGITDPSGNTWTYTYNLIGEQTKAVDPDAGTTVTGYDAAGNITYTTDANNTTENFTYDALNRKTAEYTGSVTPGQGTKVATWVWDTLKKGLLSYETSITSSGTYDSGNLGYDVYGNVSGTWVTVPSGQPLAGTYRTQYSYSSTGLLMAETPAGGGGLPVDALTFTYDQYGNPVTETGYDDYVSGAVYTPYNEVSQIDLGTGPSAAALTYNYDPQTRNITQTNLSDDQPSPQVDNTAYAYNGAQQVSSVTDTQGATGSATETQCFDYDGLSRLSQAWTSTDACAQNPATAGNSTVNGPQPYWQSWTFDQLGDILSQTNYATAGSSAGNNTTSYSYGVAGHAHAVSSTAAKNSVTNNTTTTSYLYDADGQTTSLGSQSLTWNYNGTLAAAGTTSYRYDADGNELAETTASGTTLYLPGEQLTTSSTGTSGVRYYTFDGKIVGETNGSTLYWTESNPQGTLTTAVNAFSESSPAIRRTVTPYGTPVTGSGAWPDNRTFLNDTSNTTAGLIDIGARKFDPATDTFISLDPQLDAAEPQTMTGYTYSADDPVNNADPSGKMLCEDDVCGSLQYLESRPAPSQQTSQTYYFSGPTISAPTVPFYVPPVVHVQPHPFDVWSLVNPTCGGTGCTVMATGLIGASAKFSYKGSVVESQTDVLAKLREGMNEGTGIFRNMNDPDTPWRAAKINSQIETQASELAPELRAMRIGGYGLAVIGGGVSAYGEYNETHSWAKAATVGVGDTAIGIGAGIAGGVLGGMVAGTEIGAAIGSVIPGGGTVVGAVAGAIIGAGISLVASNAFNDVVNSSWDPLNW
jgi:RHS repeat-associated protein